MWFHVIFINPMLNAMMWFYHVLPGHDLGVAIILLTLLIKLILFFPSLSSIKSQHQLQDIQPKVDAIKKKYAGNKEEMNKKMLEFYKENKVNPFSSCLPLLIQLPILYALIQVFYVIKRIDPGTHLLSLADLKNLYEPLRVIFEHAKINANFLGFIDLAATKNYVLAILSGVASYFQIRMMQSRKPEVKSQGSKDEGIASIMNKQTSYVLPAFTVILGISFPSGITLYWLASTVFTIIQQWYFIKRHKHPTVTQEIQKV